MPPELLARDLTGAVAASEPLQEVLIEVYRRDAKNAELCERLVDLDEGLQEWRYRHVKMVQRTIGTRTGTGGSSGAAYLSTTLMQPLFPDLVGDPHEALRRARVTNEQSFGVPRQRSTGSSPPKDWLSTHLDSARIGLCLLGAIRGFARKSAPDPVNHFRHIACYLRSLTIETARPPTGAQPV